MKPYGYYFCNVIALSKGTFSIFSDSLSFILSLNCYVLCNYSAQKPKSSKKRPDRVFLRKCKIKRDL